MLLFLNPVVTANPSPAVVSIRKLSSGASIQETDGVLQIDALADGVLRVRFTKDGKLRPQRVPTILAEGDSTRSDLSEDARTVTVRTAKMSAVVDKATGALSFTAKGKVFLAEQPGSRGLTPIDLPGAFQSEQAFRLGPTEGIYGLGQHQEGFLDYRGSVVTMEQQNREVAIPFMVSNRGYGLLWNNPAGTRVSVDAKEQPLDPSETFGDDGNPGGLTGHYFRGREFGTPVMTRIDPNIDFEWSKTPPPGLPHDDYSVRWTGSFMPKKTGTYSFKTVADDGVRMWIDDKQIIDDWSTHPPRTDMGRILLAGGTRHSVRLEYFQGGGGASVSLAKMAPTGTIDWSSEASEGIDYCVFYGPSLDKVMAEYRHTTGEAPMPPKWALGYWQSKERYASQSEWSAIANEYRSRQHPIDVLVQDWFYWDPYPWGSHEFDPKRYPDPAAGLSELHDDHLHSVISVWGLFAPSKPDYPNRNRAPLAEKGYLLPNELRGDGMRFYDAFNPGARKMYWEQVRDEIYSKGFDGWWLDASEPEVDMQTLRRSPTAAGPGALVLNAWPLMHTIAVSEGQLAAAPEKRVVILTRSAYAGQQRTGAITWSGDITATWKVFADQIPAGLNFCMSGIPYWTTDIGAFFAPRDLYPAGNQDPAYRELFTRWFQYGAFCPIFRVHGTDLAKEMWRFGPDTEKILDRYDQLRYRLMPYIYSQAWQVTNGGGTLMRGLVMDFPSDVQARECKDEFMFGPSLLICPVIQAKAMTRDVYLPASADWFDFWTGTKYRGGQTITADSPIDKMPIFVKAGSILPLGPSMQYANEKPADPIELRLYPGGSSELTLYEDEGDGHGAGAVIPISWNGTAGRLRLGTREGSFPGMLKSRTFRCSVVAAGSAVGLEPARSHGDIVYDGKAFATRVIY